MLVSRSNLKLVSVLCFETDYQVDQKRLKETKERRGLLFMCGTGTGTSPPVSVIRGRTYHRVPKHQKQNQEDERRRSFSREIYLDGILASCDYTTLLRGKKKKTSTV